MSSEPAQLKSEEIMEQKALRGSLGVSGGAVKTTPVVTASNPPKITSVEKPPKPKDPKRVAAGKRLAELSRQARERKKQEAEFAKENLEESKTTNFLPIFSVVSVFVDSFLYFKYRKVQEIEEKPIPPKKKEVKRNFQSMDDSE